MVEQVAQGRHGVRSAAAAETLHPGYQREAIGPCGTHGEHATRLAMGEASINFSLN